MAKKHNDSDTTSLSEIDKVLETIQKGLIEEFGEDGAMRLSDASSLCNIDVWFPTGSIVVDAVIRGGRPVGSPIMPGGRQIEISGPPAVGKTTLVAMLAAQVQKAGGMIIATDTEERIDAVYWTSLGVDVSKVINLRAQTLEDVFVKQFKCIELMMSSAPDTPFMMLWDSVGATFSDAVDIPNKDQSFMEAAERNMGRDAKTISAGMRVINKMIAKSKCMYVYTNHVYHRIGVIYGDKTATPGGEKLKFFATLRLELSKGQAIREEDASGNEQEVGRKIWVKALKNSMSPVLMKKEAVLLGGVGFDNNSTVFDVGKERGLIESKGAWCTWEPTDPITGEVIDTVKFSGAKGFKEKVVTHPHYQLLVDEVVKIL